MEKFAEKQCIHNSQVREIQVFGMPVAYVHPIMMSGNPDRSIILLNPGEEIAREVQQILDESGRAWHKVFSLKEALNKLSDGLGLVIAGLDAAGVELARTASVYYPQTKVILLEG